MRKTKIRKVNGKWRAICGGGAQQLIHLACAITFVKRLNKTKLAREAV